MVVTDHHLAGADLPDANAIVNPNQPGCHFPSKNRWIKQLRGILEDFKPDTVVCHSLANTLWFWLCNEADLEEISQVKKLFLVSPPSITTEVDTIKTFFPCALPNDLHAKEIQMIVSDNDPYIKVEEAQMMVDHYNIPLSIVNNAGHINTDSGYGKWEYIEKLVLDES